jgi:alanyl-tRNA synthetase
LLGNHVEQKGSLVSENGLRFDFTHFNSLTTEQIEQIENIVNKQIRANLEINTEIKTITEAKKDNVIALFNEKYGEMVRVVSIEDYSKELCGGTHIKNTSEIGLFKIISEASTAAGIRRIEATTGLDAENYYKEKSHLLSNIMKMFSANNENIIEKLTKLIDENKAIAQEIEKLKQITNNNFIDDLLKKTIDINGINLVFSVVNAITTEELKTMADTLREKLLSGIGILVAIIDDKISIIVVLTNDLTTKYSAGKIINELLPIVNGRGGGKADFAMAGGKEIGKITELMDNIPQIIKMYLLK